MESIHWFIDLESGAVVSGTYEGDLRFDIFVGTAHATDCHIMYKVTATEPEGINKKFFGVYSDAIGWIDRVCQGQPLTP